MSAMAAPADQPGGDPLAALSNIPGLPATDVPQVPGGVPSTGSEYLLALHTAPILTYM